MALNVGLISLLALLMTLVMPAVSAMSSPFRLVREESHSPIQTLHQQRKTLMWELINLAEKYRSRPWVNFCQMMLSNLRIPTIWLEVQRPLPFPDPGTR